MQKIILEMGNREALKFTFNEKTYLATTQLQCPDSGIILCETFSNGDFFFICGRELKENETLYDLMNSFISTEKSKAKNKKNNK